MGKAIGGNLGKLAGKFAIEHQSTHHHQDAEQTVEVTDVDISSSTVDITTS
ncbi:hypothetical protein IQ264_22225 [Phormidium sp. LEGE 05292]|uniref:hypothetical protein n=1 Tax=[Phormidium] sp. LEGE 05292 TaxID=767427 RepID=UPI001881A116|nr:hypothetical protein [Phormidium sp. LEGE 05292]MBE9228143.1 hypothetical protein [Phormidium sp. LEGE 05292]